MTDLANDAAVSDRPANGSLRAALENAFAAQTTETVETAPAEPKKDAPRAPDGKFAKATTDKETVTADPAVDQSGAEQKPTAPVHKPPASWTPEQKALWNNLDPAIQETVLKREKDFQTGLEKKAKEYAPYESVMRAIEPYRGDFEQFGLSPDVFVQRLAHANRRLMTDGPAALRELAQLYGVDLAQVANPQTTQQNDPTVAQLQRQVAELKAQADARARFEAQQTEQSLAQQIQAFAANPANEHFDAVKGDMIQVLNAGAAQTLEEAYEKAVWLNPATREALVNAKAQASAQTAQQQAAVAKAKAASVSAPVGSPRGDVKGAQPKRTLRETIVAAARGS